MKKLLSRWARRLALLLALPIGLGLFGVGYFIYKVATYEQLDDTARMQSNSSISSRLQMPPRRQIYPTHPMSW